MAHNKQTRKMRIATLLLAFLMVLSFCAFIFAACANTDSDDDETSETRTDTQAFANANFEYFDDSDGSYLIGNAESWTNGTVSNSSGTSSSSSVPKSGIVDTAFDWGDENDGFYNAYQTYLYYNDLEENDPDSPELEDAEYYTDIDNHYDIPGWDVIKTKYADNDDYDLTDADDIEALQGEINQAAHELNPGTHWTGSADQAALDEENGTHVLMLHNYRSNDRGTAQRYTSSSITVAAGTTVKFSVWVKTAQLTYAEGTVVDGDRGAYIAVSNTVGGATQDAYVVRNIDTSKSDNTATNGWEQYTFYVKASDYAATTFTVELGLGRQGEGSGTSYLDYVQGYAFFDDLQYEVKTAAGFESEISALNLPANQNVTLNLAFGNTYEKVDATKVTDKTFVLNLNDITTGDLELTSSTTGGSDYAEAFNGVRPTTDDRDCTIENGTVGLSANDRQALIDSKTEDKKYSGWMTYADIVSSYPGVITEGFENIENLPFYKADGDVLLLYSSEGAPYTAEATSDTFTLQKDSYLLISFWVKTSNLHGGTGATVSLVQLGTGTETKTSIGAVDTTTLETIDLTDDINQDEGKYGDEGITSANVREDIFDGWQQCFFFVSNTTDDQQTFSIEFNYGLTSGFASATKASFTPGYAAFAGFQTSVMEEEQFNVKTTGTYAVEVALSDNSNPADSQFDDVSDLSSGSEAIKEGIGLPANYDGVSGGSNYVGGSDIGQLNQNKNSGLINKEYADTYKDRNESWYQILTTSSWYSSAISADNWWNDVFGEDCTQPLLIVNTVQQAYGYIAKSETTISSSSYTAITLRVKLSPGATANIYLIDTTAPETTDEDLNDPDYVPQRYTDPLLYNAGISYRYDSKGNVVTRDEDDDNFSSKNDTLFYLQDNGLWSKERNATGDLYYANLANYEEDDDGNLVDSSGNIVYYVSDVESEKGTVYYRYKDADTDELSVKVSDFSEGYTAEELSGAILQDLQSSEYDKALKQTVTNETNYVSDWIYVRFFIATGDESKSYRLEVWSGDRDDATVGAEEANSFVAFEMVNYGTLDADTFNNLVNARIDELIVSYNANKPADADTVLTAEELIDVYRANPADFVNGTYGAIVNDDNVQTHGSTELIYFLYSLYDDDDYASYDADHSDSTASPYESYDASSYSDTVAYLKTSYLRGTDQTQYYDTYVNYGASEITVASSDDSTDNSTDDSTTDTTPSYNVWLLSVSIILAAVLILTLLLLLIRKLLANIKAKRPAKHAQAYDNRHKRYIRKLNLEEAEKSDMTDDVLPEDDEISEEDIYKVDSEEDEQADTNETDETESDQAQSEPSDETDKKDGE